MQHVFLNVIAAVMRIRSIAHKEFLHILRDPRSLALAILMPLMMVLLYGYAIDMDIKRLKVGILDLDHSSAERRLHPPHDQRPVHPRRRPPGFARRGRARLPRRPLPRRARLSRRLWPRSGVAPRLARADSGGRRGRRHRRRRRQLSARGRRALQPRTGRRAPRRRVPTPIEPAFPRLLQPRTEEREFHRPRPRGDHPRS